MAISKVPIIENCCLCASASSEYTVLLICPNPKNMPVSQFKLLSLEEFRFSLFQNYTEKHFGERDWHKLVDDDDFNQLILKDVQDACKKGGIERFETPQRVKVVTEPWLPESGLVTDALKLKRKAIEQKYKDDIEDLYLEKTPKQSSKKTIKSKTTNENPTDLSKKDQ